MGGLISFAKGCFEVLQILWMIAEDYNRAVSVSLEFTAGAPV